MKIISESKFRIPSEDPPKPYSTQGIAFRSRISKVTSAQLTRFLRGLLCTPSADGILLNCGTFKLDKSNESVRKQKETVSFRCSAVSAYRRLNICDTSGVAGGGVAWWRTALMKLSLNAFTLCMKSII